jgi:hypothetical protein
VAIPRLVVISPSALPRWETDLEGAVLHLPEGPEGWQNVFTGEARGINATTERGLMAHEVFRFPVALLVNSPI